MGLFRGVELADLTLSTDRLLLRRWLPDDAARVYEAMQDASTRRFLVHVPDPYGRGDAREFVTGAGHEGRDNGTGLGSAVVERASGRVVGAAALRLRGDPEIGYWVAPDARGHGYAAEGTRLLTGWAMGLGVPRVELHCDVRNLPSARTALRAGFAFEGIASSARQGGGTNGVPARYGDDARFARTADDSGDAVEPAFPRLPDGGLTDGVVTLRPARPEDAQGYLEDDDPVAVSWGFDGRPRTHRQAEQRMAGAGLEWLVGRNAWLTVVDVGTGAFAGDLQVRRGGPPGVAELGYAVHPAFRGRGYTSRALRLIVPWVFEVAGFGRIEVGAKRGNIASQRAAQTAGFRPDGIRERRLRNADGSFADEVCFVLLRPA
ncbi:GNAT family N-acetyltransferase [uncultured Jatrophihabitans sp.]|uniref:GNAT family N-acetyltransferase n=1 Tax=uncultured Jatrophihabitans sp. TaxID=1610747 RepID=UPI0035CC210E